MSQILIDTRIYDITSYPNSLRSGFITAARMIQNFPFCKAGTKRISSFLAFKSAWIC